MAVKACMKVVINFDLVNAFYKYNTISQKVLVKNQ
jgi:hypothetical protein